jgi:hypothetical protein
MITFDFGDKEYELFLAALPLEQSDSVREALTRRPFSFNFTKATAPVLTIAARIGELIITNSNESYVPFRAEAFF